MVCGSGELTQKCCSKTLPVHVRVTGQTRYITCYCILDEQSNSSFCDPSLPLALGLSPARRTYSLSTLSGYRAQVSGGVVKGLEVKGIHEDRWLSLPELLTHPSIPDTTSEVATAGVVSAHNHISHLAGNFDLSIMDCAVSLLIGVNCGAAMYTEPHGNTFPFAHHTALGWCLVGPVCKDATSPQHCKTLRTTVESCEHFRADGCFEDLIRQDLIRREFDVSTYSPEDELPGDSQYDKKFLDKVEAEICKNGRGNVQMPLSFKDESDFPDNSKAVYMRTKNTLLRIAKDLPVAAKCVETMQSYIDQGHVEQLANGDRGLKGRTNYIPVFPVTHPKKEKVRLVFDGASTYQGTSINDKLLRGPDVANRLIGVMLRFRLHEVAFVSDVECMFHSFHVTPRDRDALRFFWWADNDPSKEVTAYRANVHIFGNKSSPAIATYGLRYTTKDPEVSHLVKARNFILTNVYVDDGMGSADTVEEAIQILVEAREILARYNIRLHKIISPSEKLLSAFPVTELAKDVDTLDISRNPAQSALGVTWNIQSDCFHLRYVEPKTEFTRRAILSVNGSVYDPMGMASPISLGGRILQRKFISSGDQPFDWDEPLPKGVFRGGAVGVIAPP